MNNSRIQDFQKESFLLHALLENQSEWDWVIHAGKPIYISQTLKDELTLSQESAALAESLCDPLLLRAIADTALNSPDIPEQYHDIAYIKSDGTLVEKKTKIRVIAGPQDNQPVYLGRLIPCENILPPEVVVPGTAHAEAKPDYKSLHHFLRLICDNEPDIIWAKDVTCRYIFVNMAMCRVLLNARDTDEPIGKSDQFFADRENAAHPEDPHWYEFGKLCAETDAVVLKSLKTEKFVEQGKVRGKFLALEVYKAPFFDENGKLLGIVGCGRDITAEIEREQQLQRSEKHFKVFSESLPGAVFICQTDAFFTMQFMNNEIERLTGYPKESFQRNEVNFFSLITSEYQLRVCSEISNAITERRTFHAIFRLLHKDGKSRWLDIRGMGVYEEDKATRLQGFISDLTVLITAELKQRENSEKYRMLLNNIRDSVYVYPILPDKSPGNFIEVNDIACRQLGYSRTEFLQMTPYHISESDKFEQLHHLVALELRTKGESVCHLNHITKNGDKVPVELFTRRLRIGGQHIGISVSRDLSERIHAKEALEESQLRFDAFMKHLTAIAFVRDEDRKLVYVNPSFEKNFGQDIIGKTFDELFNGEQAEKFLRADEKVAKYGTVTNEYTLPDIKGHYKTWLFSMFKVPRFGKPPLVGGVGIDITRQKDVEYELIKAKNDAEQLNRLKTSLMTNLSHEVRTPMNGIIGFSEILSDTQDEGVRKHASSINYSARRLMHTLDSILLLSSLESRMYAYRPEVMKIGETLLSITNSLQQQVKEKNLVLTCSGTDDLLVFADKELLETCFRHVVENAIKFTKAGNVRIRFEKATHHHNEFVRIDFEDTGVGIAPENQATIFDAFKQESEGYGREFEGIGLGLTITRKILDLMDGRIELQSTPGIGSVFSISLPYYTKHEIPPELSDGGNMTASLPVLDGVDLPTVLLVEDNIANIELVQVYLMNKCKLDFCRNVKHALEMVAVRQYHAVLVDIHLGPGLDGVAFVQKLKQLDSYKYVPVIAVTGYVSRTERERIMAAGFNEYIAKPYSRKTLLNCLGKYYPAILR